MYRWFGVVPQGGGVFSPSFFVVISSLAGDFAPKSLLNRTQFGGFSSWASS
jgi:hypothetical protein